MTYLDINELVSKEILPEINSTIEEYLEDKFSYIEDENDLEDLENSEVEDDLIAEVRSRIASLIDDLGDDYDFSKVDEEMDEEELFAMIESSYNDYRDLMVERYNDKFDREEYLDEYYSETEF